MFLIFFLLSFIFYRAPVSAIDEFKISQNILYQVDQNGSARVKHEVELTNNISQIYAKEYEFNLSGSTIQNVVGGHPTRNGDLTNILVTFDKPVVGKDQTNQFFVNYSIPDFAKKKGNTWEIQFPVYSSIVKQNDINITLEIPLSFGDLSFSSITINNTHTLNNLTQIRFTQNQVQNKILLIFGNHQLFDFKLEYYLQNKDHQPINTIIPIPPDTNSQTITLRDINPRPQNIIADADGNWLASYILNPQEEINITVDGQAKIHPSLHHTSNPDIQSYLRPQEFWPIDDPQIKSTSQSLTTPKSIYQYVVDHLEYNYNGINSATRQGALYALNFPNQSLCTEFTDLFVTLARSKQIPAREIEGFAYSNNSKIKPTNLNSDILHAWPEYFDSSRQQWIQIDPTWEKTTNGIDYFTDMDLNHFTFVIHGLSSNSPPPPGSYKKDKNIKSVYVDFATENLAYPLYPPRLTLNYPKLTVANPNPTSLNGLNLQLKNSPWQSAKIFLPPFSFTTIDLPQLPFLTSILPQSRNLTFTVTYNQNQTDISLLNKQHYFNLSLIIGISVFLLCLGGIILTVSIKHHEKNP